MEFVYFIGDDGVGKSTMAQSLQNIMHQGCKKRTVLLSFSDALREELITLYGIPKDIVLNKSINKNKIILRLGDYTVDESIPELWNMIRPIDFDGKFEDIEITLRELLITHGSRIRRIQDPYYWSKKLDEKVATLDGHCDIVVIDDARDPDDFEYSKNKSRRIYHLTNGIIKKDTNLAQERLNEWVNMNPQHIRQQITVPVPLLHYTAEKLNIQHILPEFIPRKKRSKIYFDW